MSLRTATAPTRRTPPQQLQHRTSPQHPTRRHPQIRSQPGIPPGQTHQPIGVCLHQLSDLLSGRPRKRAPQIDQPIQGLRQKHLVIPLHHRLRTIRVQQRTHRRQLPPPRTKPAARNPSQQLVLQIDQRVFDPLVRRPHQRRAIRMINLTSSQRPSKPVERRIQRSRHPRRLSRLPPRQPLRTTQPRRRPLTTRLHRRLRILQPGHHHRLSRRQHPPSPTNQLDRHHHITNIHNTSPNGPSPGSTGPNTVGPIPIRNTAVRTNPTNPTDPTGRIIPTHAVATSSNPRTRIGHHTPLHQHRHRINHRTRHDRHRSPQLPIRITPRLRLSKHHRRIRQTGRIDEVEHVSSMKRACDKEDCQPTPTHVTRATRTATGSGLPRWPWLGTQGQEWGLFP